MFLRNIRRIADSLEDLVALLPGIAQTGFDLQREMIGSHARGNAIGEQVARNHQELVDRNSLTISDWKNLADEYRAELLRLKRRKIR